MKIILSILLSFTLLVSGDFTLGQVGAEPKKEEGTLPHVEAQHSDRQASVPIDIIEQNGEEKCLVPQTGESVNFAVKMGYHIIVSRRIKCCHTSSAINGSVRCNKAAKPLKPTREELLNGVELTGKLKGKKFTKTLTEVDAGGVANTVTHLQLDVNIEEIETGGERLASPYVCGDGYAGYAYFEKHYSYCPNTEKFYKVQESHVWLGCTRGDAGTNEYHPVNFAHEFDLYKCIPNNYTVEYKANGGNGTEKSQKATYDKSFTLRKGTGISRTGYTLTGWNTKANGSGKSYRLGGKVENLSSEDGGKITLYAQWEPNVYTITLDNRLANPDRAGTEKIYKKFQTGMFYDIDCMKKIAPATEKIVVPQKSGYRFKGYYVGDGKSEKEMIDAAGKLTGGKDNAMSAGDETWHARYSCLVGCEDYADIPCDFAKSSKDIREDTGVQLIYDSSAGKVTVHTGQTGCSVSLAGQPVGTQIGKFKASRGAGSASGDTGRVQDAEISTTVLEGAAYRLKVTKGDKIICDRLVYYKDGRFRTLVKLGEKEKKEAFLGSSLAGSAWGTKESAYDMYRYDSCSEIKNIQQSGNVQRYFRYKDVNMAYSGNGATAGSNTLEYDVSLENFYQFRENEFSREVTEKKQTKDAKEYQCRVKYSFQGWELSPTVSYSEKQREQSSYVYQTAKTEKAISSSTTEDIKTYQAVSSGGNHAAEYINLLAKWDAFPTIVVTPGDELEFYEGEEVTKEKIISHLTAHDGEDNDKNNRPYKADLNDSLRIVKISYPKSENGSQGAYVKFYEKDVPGDFLLDTYYLKLEKDEVVNVLVTFAVTDSAGNTTEQELPIKVKYNNYPKINSEQTFYYLKEEANRGEITAEALMGRASAEDAEDGDISGKLGLRDFDVQAIKMQMESKAEFDVTYQVTDSYKKTAYRTIKVMVWDEDAAIAEMPKNYVRYISEKYLDTLEKNSIWREPENEAYLRGILRNKTPIETWVFTHEDVLAVQEWLTEGGTGNWKVGQEANRQFLAKFAYCRK